MVMKRQQTKKKKPFKINGVKTWDVDEAIYMLEQIKADLEADADEYEQDNEKKISEF